MQIFFLVSIKMAKLVDARIKPVLVYLLIYIHYSYCQQPIPNVQIEKLQPKGVRVSIPDGNSLSLFVFQGKVNRQIKQNEVGTISGEVLASTSGRWTFEDPNVEIKNGDIIYYYIFISVGSKGYLFENQQYTVQDKPKEEENVKEDCTPSITEVRGSRNKICSGDVLFEDEFNSLDENTWLIEQKLPIEHPEHPFVSYQRQTVTVKEGFLTIKPVLQQFMEHFTNDSIYWGTLDLYNGCTESTNACYMVGSGSNILPPIVSGRISSKGYAFKYGTITVRAKLPQGDWLYPEILLEPFIYKYGKLNFASGVIKIASARGNKILTKGQVQYGNNILYGGPIMHSKCYDKFLGLKISGANEYWGDTFHDYAVRWEPEKIKFLVDNVEWARVDIGDAGLRQQISKTNCRNAPHTLWEKGGNDAPFDEFFYLTLGVAAGGTIDFIDGLTSGRGHIKPWTNFNTKAKLRFWQELDSWYPTWNDNAKLIVDKVVVNAL